MTKPIIDSDVVDAVVGVHCFFNDVKKVALWFQTPNPHFGGASPQSLINSGRAYRVKQFVNAALEEGGKITSRPQTKSRQIGNEPQEPGAL